MQFRADYITGMHGSSFWKRQTQIADVIVEFGWTNPILIDAEGRIVAGHGRFAARKLRLDLVPVIILGHLTLARPTR